VVAGLKEMAGYGPSEEVARALYAEGEALYAQQRYRDAAARFKSAAARWPDSPLEEDALFMAGESFFFSDRYPKANDFYERLLDKYDYSRHVDKVSVRLFAIGRYWEQMHTANPTWPIAPNLLDGTRPLFDTWGNAIKAYDMVRMHDPIGPLADDSIMAAANAHFLKGHYEEAAYHYDLLRKEYANSEHQVPAHLLAMKSKLAMYQGPMYDGAPLEDAGEIADQTLAQFRTELGEERDLVIRTKNHIVEQKAAREWGVGQYYDKRRCYGAARMYYQSILEDYPHTAVAEQARTRLQEIQGLPDEPPNRFRWLGNMFPSESEAQAQALPKPAPLEWITGLLRRQQHPSEEFRDEPIR